MYNRYCETGRKCSNGKGNKEVIRGKKGRENFKKSWEKMETRRRGELKGRVGEWEKNQMCHVQAHIPYNEYDHYAYLKCTNKFLIIKKKRNNGICSRE